MDVDSNEQLELKDLLVDLEYEHHHLEVTVRQLQKAISKRELYLREVLAKRELNLVRGHTGSNHKVPLRKSQTVDFDRVITNRSDKFSGDSIRPNYSSNFTREVNRILDDIISIFEQSNPFLD